MAVSVKSDVKKREASRGEATRNALIESGLKLFGDHGLNGTTTRMLSEHSGANIAAIQYYFGSKEGLYRAVLEHIVQQFHEQIGDYPSRIREAQASGELTVGKAKQLFLGLLEAMATMFIETDEPLSWAQIMVQEQAAPTESFDLLYERQISPIQNVLSVLIGTCIGKSPSDDEVKLRVHALIGQILVFTVSREALLRSLDTPKLDKDHVELAHRVLTAHAEACLGVSLMPGNPSRHVALDGRNVSLI